MATQDFLVELGTEELPPKALKPLSDAFTRGITNGLEEAGIQFGKVEAFAALSTPCRYMAMRSSP